MTVKALACLLMRFGVLPDHADALVTRVGNVQVPFGIEADAGGRGEIRVAWGAAVPNVNGVLVRKPWSPGKRGDNAMAIYFADAVIIGVGHVDIAVTVDIDV